ncbi:hypothetical protein ABMA27_005927 [Loxostege sticticalis]|uniref:Uncharacterized protein n=1 Tax=Loxostege sticticalis TaxID=481309 RepID=A0ABR3HGZ5_LOXSC
MKFLAVFAAVCAVASASKGWTLTQLSSAVASPVTDAALKPVLSQALNQVMDNIFSQDDYVPSTITTQEGVAGHYNLVQLEALLQTEKNPVFVPFIEEAFEKLISAIFAGEEVETIALMLPALDITYMTLQELDQALSSPATNPATVPYLEYALNQYMDALITGQQLDGIVVAVPAGSPIGGALEAETIVMPAPVVPAPIVPAPIVVEPETSASSPLVQIILNVRKSEDLDVVAPTPIELPKPDPIQIVEQPILKPDPIQIVEQPIIKPDPIQVVEQPIVKPDPIQIAPMPIVKPDPIQIVPMPIVKPEPIQIVPMPIVKPDPIQIVQGPANPIDAIALPIEALPPTPGMVNAVAPMV